MLVLHIGLPKTATSWLQHRVLAKSEAIAFVHRGRGAEEAALCAELRFLAKAAALRALIRRPGLLRRIDRAAAAGGVSASRPLVISDENIAVRSAGFWVGDGPTPDRLARRLAALGRRLDRGLGPLRVLVGLRRQDEWLASRYAESSKHFPEFGQDDFDRRLSAIAAGAPLDGPLAWLDHGAVAASFATALGVENVLLLPLDRLEREPAAVLASLGRFMGGVDLADAGPGRMNRLGLGGGVWRMRRDDDRLSLRPELSAAVLARFTA